MCWLKENSKQNKFEYSAPPRGESFLKQNFCLAILQSSIVSTKFFHEDFMKLSMLLTIVFTIWVSLLKDTSKAAQEEQRNYCKRKNRIKNISKDCIKPKQTSQDFLRLQKNKKYI